MGFISHIFFIFTRYTNSQERAVGRFFKSLTERSNKSRTRTRLLELLQHDIAVINLWTEYRYKGYKYLRKSERKKLYANLHLIAEDFDRFFMANAQPAGIVAAVIQQTSPHALVDPETAVLLQAIMDYLSPNRGTYEYRDSSSFGRLLRDPSKNTLVGDCNQIVTLYIYLFSRYQDVLDLQVRVLPGHVALHCSGADIEATKGLFANYDAREDGKLFPVEEIVSINLLDITDSYLDTHEVAAEDMLQASRFAFILSHDRDIVTRNLESSYKILIKTLMKKNNFHRALDFAKASRDMTLLNIVGHNGAVYEIGQHNFAAARRYAQHAFKRDELTRSSWLAEGAYCFKEHRYKDAIKAFEHSGDQTLVHQGYEALFFEEQEKLGSNVNSETIKKQAGTIKRMHGFAKKSGNKKLIEHAKNLKKYT